MYFPHNCRTPRSERVRPSLSPHSLLSPRWVLPRHWLVNSNLLAISISLPAKLGSGAPAPCPRSYGRLHVAAGCGREAPRLQSAAAAAAEPMWHIAVLPHGQYHCLVSWEVPLFLLSHPMRSTTVLPAGSQLPAAHARLPC